MKMGYINKISVSSYELSCITSCESSVFFPCNLTQDPTHDSPTDPHRPSPPPTGHVPTDNDTGPLVELTDDHPLGEDYSLVTCTQTHA